MNVLYLFCNQNNIRVNLVIYKENLELTEGMFFHILDKPASLSVLGVL